MADESFDAAAAAAGAGTAGPAARKAAVLGKPITHSKSPLLHRAAYRELGLTGWTYERIECDADGLPALVDSLGPEWAGLSVTMPGKFAALAYATETTARAELVGSANTLVRTPTGWRADCTDVDGVIGAVAELEVRPGTADGGGPPVVLGAGGTARPAIAALAELGARDVVVAVRDRTRATGAIECAQRAGCAATVVVLGSDGFTDACAAAPVVISTLPGDAAGRYVAGVRRAQRFLDVAYEPWPTLAARAVLAGGGRVVGGLSMLLNQAYGQVEQFTGLPAPRAAMAAALR